MSAGCTAGSIVRGAGNYGWPCNGLWYHWLMPISGHFRRCNLQGTSEHNHDLVKAVLHIATRLNEHPLLPFITVTCIIVLQKYHKK